ncbi:MAG: hypothetical protein ACHQ5A_11265 [Opitutales bacterium]
MAARDIRLELAAGERRVEVRLVDRGGEMHLAVRTPDQRLSGALRENLSDLSARLEQNGYRAEAWHTGSAAGESLRETRLAGSPQDPHPQSRQDEQRQGGDRQPRQPREFEEQPNRKDKGKEFAWFMSSLR